MNFTRCDWQLVVGKSHLLFLGADRVVGWGGGGGDRKWVRMLVVPFTVSQTLVDYQRPGWYLLGCFSLNKISEISIARTILMIWLEPLEHIDKGVLIFGSFQPFLCLNWYFLGVDISCCHSHTDKTRVPFIILQHPRPLMYRGSTGGADTCSALEI